MFGTEITNFANADKLISWLQGTCSIYYHQRIYLCNNNWIFLGIYFEREWVLLLFVLLSTRCVWQCRNRICALRRLLFVLMLVARGPSHWKLKYAPKINKNDITGGRLANICVCNKITHRTSICQRGASSLLLLCSPRHSGMIILVAAHRRWGDESTFRYRSATPLTAPCCLIRGGATVALPKGA